MIPPVALAHQQRAPPPWRLTFCRAAKFRSTAGAPPLASCAAFTQAMGVRTQQFAVYRHAGARFPGPWCISGMKRSTVLRFKAVSVHAHEFTDRSDLIPPNPSHECRAMGVIDPAPLGASTNPRISLLSDLLKTRHPQRPEMPWLSRQGANRPAHPALAHQFARLGSFAARPRPATTQWSWPLRCQRPCAHGLFQ